MPTNAELVHMLYQGVTDTNCLEMFWEEFSKAAGSSHSSITIRNKHTHAVNEVIHHGYDDKEFDAYASHYYKRCVWSEPLLAKSKGSFHSTSELSSDSSFIKTGFYNDFAKQVGIRHGVGAVIDIPCSDDYLQLAALRGDDRAYYSEAEFKRMNDIIPHLQQFMFLRKELGERDKTPRDTEDLVNSSSSAVFLLGEECQPLYFNNVAQQLLDEEGLISIWNNRIRLNSPLGLKKIDSVVYEAVKAASNDHSMNTCCVFTEQYESNEYQFRISPFYYYSAGMLGEYSKPCAAVIVKRVGTPHEVSLNILSQLYGLTVTEAEITKMLVQGSTPTAIAAKRGVSLQTVRTQVKSIYSKLEVENSMALFSKVMTSVAVI